MRAKDLINKVRKGSSIRSITESILSDKRKGKPVTEARARDFEIEGGTVISGTLKNSDVIPALLSELERYDKGKASTIEQSMRDGEGIPDDEDDEWYDSEEAGYVIDELYDALNEVAPEGYYFGGHWGDPADIGFWPVEE